MTLSRRQLEALEKLLLEEYNLVYPPGQLQQVAVQVIRFVLAKELAKHNLEINDES